MKRWPASLILLITAMACNDSSLNTSVKDSVKMLISSDTISETRATVNPKPVANYHEKVKDELNNRSLEVKVFETRQTFYYLLKMQYEETTGTDTLRIPNIGTQPIIEIHPGREKYSCIVGFIDRQKQFREYKMVSVTNNQLKVTVLNHYGVYISVK